MERAVVHEVTVAPAHAGVTVSVPDRLGAAARLFRVVARTGVSVGAIALHPTAPHRSSVSFTVARAAVAAVARALTAAGYAPSFGPLTEVVLAGVAMRTDPAIPVIFSESLAMAGVPLTLVSLENHRLSVFCAEPVAGAAVRALCEAFEVASTDHYGTVAPRPGACR